jgi:hypothetical protein
MTVFHINIADGYFNTGDNEQVYPNIDVPFFSQNDPNWYDDQLGNCEGWYMGWLRGDSDYSPNRAAGCATTCKAMVFNYYRENFTNPDRLNSCLTENGGYVNGCLTPWGNKNNICAPIVNVAFTAHISDSSSFETIISGYNGFGGGYLKPPIEAETKRFSSQFS